jgi:hypothetical protein
MPVIECSCGMVMSTPAVGSRPSCIRCGGIEFQILRRRFVDERPEQREFAASPKLQPHLAVIADGAKMVELLTTGAYI